MSGLTGRFSSAFLGKVTAVEAAAARASGGARTAQAGDRPGAAPAADPSIQFGCRGTLYAQAGAAAHYQPVTDLGGARLVIKQTSTKPPKFDIIVTDHSTDEELLQQSIAEGFQVQFHLPTGSIMWPAIVEGRLHQMAFRFHSATASAEAVTKQFVETYGQCQYCALTGQAVPASTDEDAYENFQYGRSQFGAEVPVEDDEEDSRSAAGSASAAAAASSATADDDDVPNYDHVTRASTNLTGGGANVCFADSMKYERAVVVRSDGRGGRGETEFQAHRYTANEIGRERPQSFKIATDKFSGGGLTREALLKQNENHMLLLTTGGHLADVDLVTGALVQTYEAGFEGVKIEHVTHSDKYGDDPHVLTCLKHNGVFNIDTRLNPKQCAVVEEAPQTYARMKFTCHATSKNGFLAIGDQDGVIRLYSGPPGSKKPSGKGYFPKTSKTLLNASPDKAGIVNLDVTGDGSYILATTQKYLLVLCTAYLEEGKELCGFDARMGKHKPAPVRLELSAQQIFDLGGFDKVSFTKATFESSPTGEHWIAAVCGNNIVCWNFDRVKRAIETRRYVVGDAQVAASEAIKDAAATQGGGSLQVKFLTDQEVGMQAAGAAASSSSSSSSTTTRRGKTTFRFRN